MASRRLARLAIATVALGVLALAPASAQPRSDQALMFQRVFEALQRNFPTDFNRIAAASHKPDASTNAAAMLGEVFNRHLTDIRRAPAPNLIAIAEAERQFILGLQRHSESICAMYGETGEIAQEGLPQDLAELGIELGVRKLDAARAGLDHPVEGRLDRLSSEDGQAWVSAMRMAGATKQMLGLLDGTTSTEGVTAKDRCQAHVLQISTIISMMPTESGARIAAVRYTTS